MNGTGQPLKWCERFDYVQEVAPYYIEKAKKQGVDTKNWFSIPHFIDTGRFKENGTHEFREKLNIPPDAFVVLSVGAIIKRYKRMDWILKEVGELRKNTTNDVYLIIVGEHEEETKEIMDYGKRLLGDHVIFLNNISNNEMPQIYQSSDVFVFLFCLWKCSCRGMM